MGVVVHILGFLGGSFFFPFFLFLVIGIGLFGG